MKFRGFVQQFKVGWVLLTNLLAQFVFCDDQSASNTQSVPSIMYSPFSHPIFLREAVETICNRFSHSLEREYLAPFLPPHEVNAELTVINDYDSCNRIVAERFFSVKQGEFYGLVLTLRDEINRKLRISSPEHFHPLDYHLEGNIMGFPQKYSILQAYANDERVETICEIGFNAGFSSLFMTLHNPKAKFLEFDIFYHNYSALGLSTLQEMFPHRHFLGIAGDSGTSVPRFHAMFPEQRCNLILIDGGHSRTALRNDIINMAKLANRTYHRVLVDDTAGEWTHLYEEYVRFVKVNVSEDHMRSMYRELDASSLVTHPIDNVGQTIDEKVNMNVQLRHIEHHLVDAIANPCLQWELQLYEPQFLLSYVKFSGEPVCEALSDPRVYQYRKSSGVCVAEYLFPE